MSDSGTKRHRHSSFGEESVRQSVLLNDKYQKDSTIIFSVANAMMGPSVLLLPLQFLNVGWVSAIIFATIIAIISYRTCDLTHLHTRQDEIDYMPAIQRILGKSWMFLYFINSVVILWCAGLIYFLCLCDVTYSAIELAASNTLPDETAQTFKEFSFSYIGIIIMAAMGWLFFLPKLGKILDLTEKGIYSIIAEGIFLTFLAIKNLAEGDAKFGTQVTNNTEIPITAVASVTQALSVFAMAFCVHNAVTEIVRKCITPSHNSSNVFKAYAITLFTYLVTGIFGTIGLYNRVNPNTPPNTVLTNTLYKDADTATLVLLGMTQIASAFQLVTVLPVVNNVVRTQFFIVIFGEEGVPPKIAFIIFNLIYIASFVILQILNVSPGLVMAYGGAFIGFVIIYLLPLGIHLTTLRRKQIYEAQDHTNETLMDREPEIADFMKGKKTNYLAEYGIHITMMCCGIYIFIAQLVEIIQGS